MRIAFMGTPEFAARILIEIKEQHDIVCVHTRPDAVRGRGSKLVSSPVKRVALESGIPVREPRTLRDAGELAFLRSLAPDVVCVAAYGKILPQAVLDVPCFGCLNVHASLLPKYRGAAPIERAILAGDEQVGVCIMRMETGLDTGPFCISRSVAVAGRGCEHLTGELADIGSCALLSALAELETGAGHRPSRRVRERRAQDRARRARSRSCGARRRQPQTGAGIVYGPYVALPYRREGDNGCFRRGGS